MDGKTFRLDLTMMYAMHDALRRELVRIARVTANPDRSPRQILGTALGWEMFKSYLRVHHTSEDDALWPVMSRELAGRPDDLALIDAMEIEHAAIRHGHALGGPARRLEEVDGDVSSDPAPDKISRPSSGTP